MSPNVLVRLIIFAALCVPLLGCQDKGPLDEDSPVDMDGTADLAGAPDLGGAMRGASLAGTIRRTAMPKAGGKGPLYIAVFDGNPVVDSKNAVLVGQTLIAEADLAAADAMVSYRIEGIPHSPKVRQVLAFLDDNRTAKPPSPGPDAGDLVTLDGIAGIKVTLPSEQEVTLNLVLNAVLPKL